MIYYAVVIVCAGDSDDIDMETIVQTVIVEIAFDGVCQRASFPVVDGLFRSHKVVVASCFYFYEDDFSVFICNDIKVAFAQFPIAGHDAVAFAYKVVGGFLFSPVP